MQIKGKIAAVFSGAVMAASTMLTPVLAADLTSYPEPFVVDGSADYLIVVGSQVDTKDVVGAINVGSRLAQEVKTTTATAGKVVLSTTDSAAADGASLKVEIEDYLSNATEFLGTATNIVMGPTGVSGLTHTASFLSKKTLTVNAVDWEITEKILVNSAGVESDDLMQLEYNSSSYPNEIFFDLGQSDTTIRYMVSFNPEIYLDNLTSKTINWLGSEYVVAKGSTAAKMKLTTSTSEALKGEGESVEVEGITVTLLDSVIPNTGTPYAIFKVEGGGQPTESLDVTEAADPKQDTAERIEIYLDKAYDSYAKFYVSKAGTMKTLDESKDTYDGANWKITINDAATSTTTYPKIGNITLDYRPAYNSSSMRYLKTGDGITSPADLFEVKYNGLTTEDTANMQFTSYNKSVIKISTPGQNLFKVTGTLYADAVYYDTKGSTWYYDITNSTTEGQKTITEPIYVYFRADKPYQIAINTSSVSTATPMINVTEPTSWSRSVAGIWQFQYDNSTGTFGDYNNKALVWTDGTTSYNLYTNASSPTDVCGGSVCTGFMSPWGTKLESAAGSSITLTIPKNQIYGQVILGKESGTGKTTSGDLGVGDTFEGVTVDSFSVEGDVVVPVESSVAKLASDVTSADKSASNLIFVGGPCANSMVNTILSAEWGVDDACDAWSGKVGADEALIKQVEDAFGTGKAALIIAGDKAKDTTYACEKMMSSTFWAELTGDAVIVDTTTGDVTEMTE